MIPFHRETSRSAKNAKTTRARCEVVIPARLASSRLPRKMLLAETGKPLVQHTYEAARRAASASQVVAATDSVEIAAAVKAFGGVAEMTCAACRSGTDRVAEVARRRENVEIFVNVQGDEPEIEPSVIDSVAGLLLADPAAPMATAATPIRDRAVWEDPACVKVVCDDAGRARYFSRSPIPHMREFDAAAFAVDPPRFLLHLGIYAYRRDFLLELAALPSSPLEDLEKLEQLRVLDGGREIAVAVVPHAAAGIDTPADYRAFVARHRRLVRRAG